MATTKSSKKLRMNFYLSFLKQIRVDLRFLINLSAFLHIISWPKHVPSAESTPEFSAPALDSLLQDYAFRALVHPETGVIYDGDVPSNLTGVKVAAMRVKSSTIKKKGISSFKEIHIPGGVIERPSASKVVLVYQNLENWSESYYPLPGYTYLAPVLGFLAYKGHDLSAKNLPQLDIKAGNEPILITFENLDQVPVGLVPKCVHFGPNGAVEFSNVIAGNACSSINQGHFSIVVEFRPPPPPPSPPPPSPSPPPPQLSPPPPPPPPPSTIASPAPAPVGEDGDDKKGTDKLWGTIGYVTGGSLLFVFIGAIFIVCLQTYVHQTSLMHLWLQIPYFNVIQEIGVNEYVTLLGDDYRGYEVASGSSTRPLLENDYVI